MYERFTDRARRVFQLANQEALRLNHEYIGVEHIMLGLSKEGSGVAATALKEQGLDLETLRARMAPFMFEAQGADMTTMGKLPQTPRAKQVVERAMAAAKEMNHNYVGTEHILLAVLQDEESAVAETFRNNGVDVAAIRNYVLELLGHEPTQVAPEPAVDPMQTAAVRAGIAVRLLESMLHGVAARNMPSGVVRAWIRDEGPQLALAAVRTTDALLRELSKDA